MNTLSPYHQGELLVQKLANEADSAQRNGAVISNKIPPGAIHFVGQQMMLVVSSLDNDGKVWVSVLIGNPGFVTAPNADSLLLDTSNIISQTSDPFWHNIKTNPQIGILAIELSSRRRLRVNGTIQAIKDGRFAVSVEQAYPNCPKYIQRRVPRISDSTIGQILSEPVQGTHLTADHIELIARADSLFVGSASPLLDGENSNSRHGGDASHRGGNPGFVEVLDQRRLRIPDYKGNSMFNTLGNIELYPKAGLVFVDFEQGRLLQLSGSAKILWDLDDPDNKTGGTRRFWELSIEQWRESQLPTELSWEFFDYSPHNPRLKAAKSVIPEFLQLKVSEIEQKSERINRFRLVAANGGILPAFQAGAHLPIEVTLPDGQKAERHYSLLSSQHDNRYYEIAVQHETKGRGGSTYMHKYLQQDTIVRARPPRNDFSLSPVAKHNILIAGGIGITPILAMLRSLADSKASFEVHYSARTRADMAFENEVALLAGNKAHLYFSKGKDAKRLELETLMRNHDAETHLFVCGPLRMIAAVRELGDTLGWAPGQIHFESFGASAAENESEIEVTLKKSARLIKVGPTQTILESLIDANVSVPFDCKRGECGMCVTEVITGEVEHRDVYLTREERKHSMCVCVSRAKGKELTLNV